ncbi:MULTISPECIES: flagellar basal body L-ring protein FlgH [Pelosinus]|uniref:Flagellar L-ring protein n=1 Tax=Pelosinus fermentans B4 TaxID=1149862 RepID=I9L6G0_9FIRM|nr:MULTISPECIES: flagellar basal body L-ring protein FlgH [Pelosinus]EIW15959.1 flagellar L-ring protein [Pelosinus fermentans B4]EIW27335.1 flagellar L-ring protein [Pelosinus fermentans A11]OAM92708.1 flagellar L-ring protein [Pelosinus fermentans DSM 17108]SDQ54397.1 flagellar L-ring protein precursor FlgH [Pelosinus fermentans]
MFNLTKKNIGFLLGFLCLMFLAATPVSAMSLWSDSGASSSLYGDYKARAVGDTLTIIISENSSANRAGNAANSKSTNVNMNAGTGIFHGIASATAGNSDSFQAKGSLVNTNNVTARMTAQVLEVKPNGDLIVSGTQSIKQNGEEQKITISGIVRQADISADNTILSTYIGNAQIKIDGSGPISRKQRQGIVSQLLNFLF